MIQRVRGQRQESRTVEEFIRTELGSHHKTHSVLGEGGTNNMCSDRIQNFCGPVISMCPPLPSPPFPIGNVYCNFPNPALS